MDIYNFTGVAEKVFGQIKEGTWKFTREEGIQFFCEGIGCKKKESKHKKISLPETISYEDAPVMILGGALTLPRWDGPEGKGTVPTFLREQQLNGLRRVLIAHLKAKDAINK
jgi:hypothetical protein